jgi:hypothetical protein
MATENGSHIFSKIGGTPTRIPRLGHYFRFESELDCSPEVGSCSRLSGGVSNLVSDIAESSSEQLNNQSKPSTCRWICSCCKRGCSLRLFLKKKSETLVSFFFSVIRKKTSVFFWCYAAAAVAATVAVVNIRKESFYQQKKTGQRKKNKTRIQKKSVGNTKGEGQRY